jgi:hypothetical protein
MAVPGGGAPATGFGTEVGGAGVVQGEVDVGVHE